MKRHSDMTNVAQRRIGFMDDPVNHPKHYTSDPSGVECIEITRHRNFNVGNAIKYLWRAGLKDEDTTVEDLRKAIWYIEDEIKRISPTPEPEPVLGVVPPQFASGGWVINNTSSTHPLGTGVTVNYISSSNKDDRDDDEGQAVPC